MANNLSSKETLTKEREPDWKMIASLQRLVKLITEHIHPYVEVSVEKI